MNIPPGTPRVDWGHTPTYEYSVSLSPHLSLKIYKTPVNFVPHERCNPKKLLLLLQAILEGINPNKLPKETKTKRESLSRCQPKPLVIYPKPLPLNRNGSQRKNDTQTNGGALIWKLSLSFSLITAKQNDPSPPRNNKDATWKNQF